jgi:hypothetical protein
MTPPNPTGPQARAMVATADRTAHLLIEAFRYR